jgi:hypothetical protein
MILLLNFNIIYDPIHIPVSIIALKVDSVDTI